VLFPSFSEEANLTFGPIDPDVPILRMEDQDGKIVGSLMAWGCHPVCIYPHVSTAISADYPAFASRVVETTEGGVSLFVLGLAGNTVPVQRGARACARIGTALGGEALRRLQLVDGTDEVTLRALTKEIRLPTKRTAASDDSADDATGDDVVTEMQALKLGETCILGLPGEVLVEVGLAIKQRAGIEDLVVVTLANDAIGYVCHRQAYEEGGYEPGPGTHLASGAGEIMIEQALVLLEEIDRSGPDDAIGSPSLR